MKIRKGIFILLFLMGFLFFPRGVEALNLTLTYNEQVEGCFNDARVFPSYNNKGIIDGFLFPYSGGILKHSLDNKIVYNIKDNYSNITVEQLTATNNQGYIVNGTSDLLVTVYDASGTVIFKKQYGGNGSDTYHLKYNSYDNTGAHDGYLIVFLTTSSDLSVNSPWIMTKFDLKGNVVWEKDVKDYIKTDGLKYIKDNKVVSVFYSNGTSVVRFDESSNTVIWTKEVGFAISNIKFSYDKSGKIDGVVAVGIAHNNSSLGRIVKLGLDGDVVFSAQYEGNGINSVYYDVISDYTPNGYDGYIVTAVVGNETITDAKPVILKYDFNGKKVYEVNYPLTENFVFEIMNNYDGDGKQNGYLLFSTKSYRAVKREIETQAINKCSGLMLAKYMYLNYPVVKEATEEGTISVKSDAYPGEVVKVNVTVKEGYSLKRIIVKDENGNEIEVNGDGTFIMPEGKVTVSAIYNRIVNPDTVSACYIVLGIILVIAIGSTIVMKEKNKENLN